MLPVEVKLPPLSAAHEVRERAIRARVRGNLMEACVRLWGKNLWPDLVTHVTGIPRSTVVRHFNGEDLPQQFAKEVSLALHAYLIGIREDLTETEALIRESYALEQRERFRYTSKLKKRVKNQSLTFRAK
jgi:hypothetical protein